MTRSVRGTAALLLTLAVPACNRVSARDTGGANAGLAAPCPTERAVLVVDNRTVDQVEIVTWERGSTNVFALALPGRTEHEILGSERAFAARGRDGTVLGATGRPASSVDRVQLTVRCAAR